MFDASAEGLLTCKAFWFCELFCDHLFVSEYYLRVLLNIFWTHGWYFVFVLRERNLMTRCSFNPRPTRSCSQEASHLASRVFKTVEWHVILSADTIAQGMTPTLTLMRPWNRNKDFFFFITVVVGIAPCEVVSADEITCHSRPSHVSNPGFERSGGEVWRGLVSFYRPRVWTCAPNRITWTFCALENLDKTST